MSPFRIIINIATSNLKINTHSLTKHHVSYHKMQGSLETLRIKLIHKLKPAKCISIFKQGNLSLFRKQPIKYWIILTQIRGELK